MDIFIVLSNIQSWQWQYPFITLLISLSLLLLTRHTIVNLVGEEATKSPPSPPRLPVIGNLHQLGKFPHRSLRALSRKYGPLMLLRLGHCPTLVVSSPELVKEIVKNHDREFSDRPGSTASDLLFHGGKDIAFSRYDEHWRQARKVCTLQLLSHKRVRSFRSVREDEVWKLVGLLRGGGGAPVNLTKLLMTTSNNITTRCIIGQSYSDHGDGGGGQSLLAELAKKMARQFGALCVGDLYPSLKWVDRIRGFTGELRSTAMVLDDFYTQVVEEHKNKNNDNNNNNSKGIEMNDDFVDILLQLQKEGSEANEFDLTPLRLKAILQDMLLAGTDTSSTTVEWLMAELMKHPRVMNKLQEEVRSVVGKKAKIETDDDISRMNYLKCVVKETLRLHPPLPLLLPRETSRSLIVGGYHVPAKTKVLVNGWAIQRDPGSWVDPEEFVPERFEKNPVDFKTHEFFVPFGFGRRQCPGISFGTVNIEYIVSNLLYWFDWKLSSPEDFDMSEVNGIIVHKKLPLDLVPTPYSPA